MDALAPTYELVVSGQSSERAREIARLRELAGEDQPGDDWRRRCAAVGLEATASFYEVRDAEDRAAAEDLPLVAKDAVRLHELPALLAVLAQTARVASRAGATVGDAAWMERIAGDLLLWAQEAQVRALEAEEARQDTKRRGPRRRAA